MAAVGLAMVGMVQAQSATPSDNPSRPEHLPPVEVAPPIETLDTPVGQRPGNLPEPMDAGQPLYVVPEWMRGRMVPPANAEPCGSFGLMQYGAQRITETPPPTSLPIDGLPRDFRPWWERPVGQPATPSLAIALDRLIDGALHYSSYVRVIATEPVIRQTVIIEEQAVFDWRGFLDSTYSNTSDPVGNLLTTGTTASRFIDSNWGAQVGVRRDNPLGGNLALSQQMGTQANNSRFLLPNPQATTQLELRYTQPLFNKAGRAYNESRIVLAGLATDVASDKLISDLQQHLTRVTESYWELYRARAEYFQRLKLLEAAQATLDILEGRAKVDTVQRQILRARAAVASRRSEIARAHTSIRNAESQLRLLVNDPALLEAIGLDFAPTDVPVHAELPLATNALMYTALHNRPDISQAIREVRATSVRLGVARNEILPQLDLVASTYVAGLAARAEVGDSLIRQFDSGRPSFSVGVVFDTAFQRRAANAQFQRRQLEVQRALGEYRLTVEQALTAVELAAREVQTSYHEMVGKYQSLVAVSTEADYLLDRWKTLPGADDSAVLLLENLLDAQERVADEEFALVRAQVGYTLSIVRLKQEMGTLLVASSYRAAAAPAGHVE